MTSDLIPLSLTAISVGFVHCLAGPDHYLPFVAMSRVGLWSLRKTLVITVLCGIGHVLGSALLGFIGVALGLIAYQLEADQTAMVQSELTTVESLRGDLAGWLIAVFGLIYFVWGVVYALSAGRRQSALSDGEVLEGTESQVRGLASRAGKFTPWILFTVFVFGPCEPLIPMLLAPGARVDLWSAAWVVLLFGATTLVTMTVLVTCMYLGTVRIRFRWAETYGHALAGLVVLLCGVAILGGL